LRLLVGIRHREDRARSARASDSRRHQRNHASDHCQKPRRAMTGDTIRDGDVIVRRLGALRRLTLNRPQTINALTLGMAETMTAYLGQWAGDPAVGAVLIDGAGERGLCAGGDLRTLYDAKKSPSAFPAHYW